MSRTSSTASSVSRHAPPPELFIDRSLGPYIYGVYEHGIKRIWPA